jgi:transcription factor TGA
VLRSSVFPGAAAAALELEYAHWAEEQARHAGELSAALQSDAPEAHLRALVDAGLAHYDALFRLKSAAARRDAFLVLSGAWRAPAERLFLWIGGFRPSDLLGTLAPQLGPLAEPQGAAVRALQRTARQLEDALAQGLDKLQQTLAEALLAVDGGYAAARQMAGAVGKLDGLAGFVDQVIDRC